MPKSPKPTRPQRLEPTQWEHYNLWLHVRESVLALPGYFKTATTIEGMLASDIFTLNAALGATIEEQVVQTLNAMRSIWDPGKEYQAYSFVRQSQTFPDVLLRKKTNGQEILLGIELKGWYLLDKEKMPNFRFVVTPAACAEPDLIVVIPWALSSVLTGSPVVFSPYVELCRYAAETRNYYWEHERKADGDTRVQLADHVKPYPVKSDKISDRAREDKGSNFGRIARYGIMNEYITEALRTRICGINADEWVTFFQKHARDHDPAHLVRIQDQ